LALSRLSVSLSDQSKTFKSLADAYDLYRAQKDLPTFRKTRSELKSTLDSIIARLVETEVKVTSIQGGKSSLNTDLAFIEKAIREKIVKTFEMQDLVVAFLEGIAASDGAVDEKKKDALTGKVVSAEKEIALIDARLKETVSKVLK
jgi:hypothetical protein